MNPKKTKRNVINTSRPDGSQAEELSEVMVKMATDRIEKDLQEHDADWIELNPEDL